MESWREVFRKAFVKVAPKEGLQSLYQALQDDDQRLIQGQSTEPAPLMSLQGHPVEGACMIGYCAWRGGEGDVKTVGETEEAFADLVWKCDQIMGGHAESRWLLQYWDDTPREDARRELIKELELAGV